MLFEKKIEILFTVEFYKKLNQINLRICQILLFTFIFIIFISKLSLNSKSVQIKTNEIKNISFDILLIYIYANTHSYAYENLKYFIDNAVRENDNVDYYFILQRVDNKIINESLMPQLPKTNGHYIQHENICYDFGTIGWFLNNFTSQNNNLNNYKYFILMNSSIRGPFFPPYFIQFLSDYKNEFSKIFYWYEIFTQRITSQIKLVGSTISCAPTPHVQSFFLVTDQIGFNILLKKDKDSKGIFDCYEIKNDVSLYSEVASSTRIIKSNYLIDSLLTRYQNINFNQTHTDICSAYLNPYADNYFDGTSLEPYEVVFVKYADLEYAQLSRDRAKLYQQWIFNAQSKNGTI